MKHAIVDILAEGRYNVARAKKVQPITDDDEVLLAIEIDENTKIEHTTLDSDSPLANLIIAFILRNIEGNWMKIGIVNIFIEGNKIANWGDIIIGSDSQYLLFEIPEHARIPDPDYPHRKYRGMGIGSKIVKYFLKYLKENGIEEIYGELSDRDDYEKYFFVGNLLQHLRSFMVISVLRFKKSRR